MDEEALYRQHVAVDAYGDLGGGVTARYGSFGPAGPGFWADSPLPLVGQRLAWGKRGARRRPTALPPRLAPQVPCFSVYALISLLLSLLPVGKVSAITGSLKCKDNGCFLFLFTRNQRVHASIATVLSQISFLTLNSFLHASCQGRVSAYCVAEELDLVRLKQYLSDKADRK
ncbi:unnamed protein product, partial [Phaeothamnion confervicola]